MRAVISKFDKNAIVIENFEHTDEEIIFKKIRKCINADDRIKIKRTINGPLETIIKAECNGEDVIIYYDIDYGVCPIRCKSNNVSIMLDLINKAVG